MLFIQSNSLALSLDEGERLRLLDALAERGLKPLLRSARRRLFQSLVARVVPASEAAPAASQLERECVARGIPGGDAYTPGELFCEGDCVLALVFGRGASAGDVTASVVYDLDTAEPLARLARFCQDAREALGAVRDEGGAAELEGSAGAEARQLDLPLWQARTRGLPQGLARFIAIQPEDFVRAGAALRRGRELARASELMEEPAVRSFLRRVQELRREGYTPRRLLAEAGVLAGVASIERMLEAGLLERELRVSCRKSGHALFDLPSPDSLAAVTISRARCSQCAAPVADEVVEETFSPTRLAVALLEDGGWLANRVYSIVRSLGVPESEIATGPPTPYGESYLAVEVCGNSFLIVTRDGDLTPAFTRRVAGIVEETEATHLITVVTGSAEDEGRLRLYEFAWRRARDGRDLGTTVVEGLAGAHAQIRRAFETAVRRELSRALFTLDPALGFSASDFVLDWFKSSKAGAARARREDDRARAAAVGEAVTG
jgi:hypothetical protein